MASLPYFRWYPADARNDETYAGMTVEELGIYHAIIDHSWGNNGCPSDPVKAANAIGHGVTASQFRRVFPGISDRFIEKNGRLFERRQEEEREQALAKSLKNQRFGNANAKLSRPDREKNASQRAYGSEYGSESESEKFKEAEEIRKSKLAAVIAKGIEAEEIQRAFERHSKHRAGHTLQRGIQQIIGLGESFDSDKFRKNHTAYCNYHDRHGTWHTSTLSFCEWIEHDMPLPPPEMARPPASKSEERRERILQTPNPRLKHAAASHI